MTKIEQILSSSLILTVPYFGACGYAHQYPNYGLVEADRSVHSFVSKYVTMYGNRPHDQEILSIIKLLPGDVSASDCYITENIGLAEYFLARTESFMAAVIPDTLQQWHAVPKSEEEIACYGVLSDDALASRKQAVVRFVATPDEISRVQVFNEFPDASEWLHIVNVQNAEFKNYFKRTL